MKTLIIIVFSLFAFSFSYGQNSLDKGPFYKNAKVWKAEKKSTDVYVISNKEDIKNGLFLKNLKAVKSDNVSTHKLDLSARKTFIKGPKAKNSRNN